MTGFLSPSSSYIRLWNDGDGMSETRYRGDSTPGVGGDKLQMVIYANNAKKNGIYQVYDYHNNG